jgi:ABC-2 type transport system permease protein
MRAALSLIRKQLRDTRWQLVLSVLALFALSWLSVYSAWWTERRVENLREITRALESAEEGESFRVASTEEIEEAVGKDAARDLRREASRIRDRGTFDLPSPIEGVLFFWNMPGMLLPLLIWSIGRGTIAVAGELERGSLDLVLSRPISRAGFLATHLATTTFGLLLFVAGLVAGYAVGGMVYPFSAPPGLGVLARPSLNYIALGFAIYGICLAFSCADLVRWRPILIGTVFTILSFVNFGLAQIPSLKDYKAPLEGTSLFAAYRPQDSIKPGEPFARNVAILFGVGAVGVAAGGIAFLRRDLPSNT